MEKGSSSKRGRLLAKFRNVVSKESGGADTLPVAGSESTEAATESTTESANEPVSERRREQIRRAQRLHRQRKAEQSQRLTAEIADLRAKDVAKTARIDHLENTIAFLSNILNQNGIIHEIPQPPRVQNQAQVTVLDVTTTQPPTQSLQVSMPHSFHHAATMPSAPDIPVDLADVQVGIDFILNLEQPCLYHHHGPANNDDDLLGHSSLMQAPIMARAPPLITPANTAEPRLPSPSSWDVPGEELERLLSFSNTIRLPVEITPVQAWSLIRERGAAGWVPSRTLLDHLLQAMKPLITCYGFGALIEKSAFERLLDRYTQRP